MCLTLGTGTLTSYLHFMASHDLKQVISLINGASPLEFNIFLQVNGYKLSAEDELTTNLAGNYGALIIRSILFKLGIDENWIFNWRLENKFRQYQVINHFCQACMPETFALSAILNQENGAQNARELFANGYFLKETLGDASFATNSWNKTHLFEDIIQHYPKNPDYENFVIQKRLKLMRELRIHSFGRDIIPYLTFRIPATQDENLHQGAEQFLKDVLKHLPDQILIGTLIGWDIGYTNTGVYYVIESNFTGFHPEYRRGYQTTGYVDDFENGPIICAWLNNYFKTHYKIYIQSIDSALTIKNPFYRGFEYYSKIFAADYFSNILRKEKASPVSVITYLKEGGNLKVNLINYFHLIDFATKYWVITDNANFDFVTKSFSKKNKVKVVLDAQLFVYKQFKVTSLMHENKRESTCCFHLANKLKDSYLII